MAPKDLCCYGFKIPRKIVLNNNNFISYPRDMLFQQLPGLNSIDKQSNVDRDFDCSSLATYRDSKFRCI